MIRTARWNLLLLLAALPAVAQIDPVKRDLIQLGYNVALQGHPPLSGYAFYYRNDPGFIRTNLTLRLAVAPVFLDSELGISHPISEHTDIGIGLAGGGYADSYAEIQQGRFLPKQSFVGHSVEGSLSLYQLFNPHQLIPLYLIVRGSVHHSFFEESEDTDPAFQLPEDRTTCSLRTGLRWGGQEPMLFPALAMELSAWYEGVFRNEYGDYGYNGDRRIEPRSHLFWGQALLTYTLPELGHNFRVSLGTGTSIDADRFTAYRFGALLPMASEFPLNLPGYYYQELSAESFFTAGASYLMPLDRKKQWNVNTQVVTSYVNYLPGLEQPRHWNTGVAGGILYRSPGDSTKILLVYAYGVDAIRGNGRGAHSIGVLMQFDLQQARDSIYNPMNLNRWRGWQRLFGS